MYNRVPAKHPTAHLGLPRSLPRFYFSATSWTTAIRILFEKVTVNNPRYGGRNAVFILTKGKIMLYTILLVILILAAVSCLPVWGYSRSWGAFPAGGLISLVVIVLLIYYLFGRHSIGL